MGCCTVKSSIEETDLKFENFFDKNKKRLKIVLSVEEIYPNNDYIKLNNSNIFKEDETSEKNLNYLLPQNPIFNDFVNSVINEFNIARVKYAEKINNHIQYIKIKHTKYILNVPGRIKTTLFKGESSFKNAINHLQSIQPLPPLDRDDNIKVKFKDVNNIDFTKDSIRDYILITKQRVTSQYPNISIFPDIINDAEISAILQIVDETFEGVRRNKILNPQIKKIAISCGSNRDIKLISFTSLA